jgi:enoyl-CoA hydratase
MAFCGATLDAPRAAALGFVNAVEPDVLAAAMQAASAIAARAPLAVSASKAALNYARDHAVADSLEQAALLNAAIWHTPDILEAMRARAAKAAGQFVPLHAL